MRPITHSPVRTVKSVRCSSTGELNPVGRIFRAIRYYLSTLIEAPILVCAS
jgi:hypothetical protein